MDNFSLSDLSLNQANFFKHNDVHIPERVLYTVSSGRLPKIQVTQSGGQILVRIDSWNFRKIYNCDDKELIKIRHEMVASLCGLETDTPMSELTTDPILRAKYKYTPDYIDIPRRIVIELTTSDSTDEQTLTTSYEGKISKYRDPLIEMNNCTFFVLVVGSDKILTNLSLSSRRQKDLCLRMKVGRYVEIEIVKILGKDIYRPDDMEDISAIQEIFKSIEEPVTKHLNFDIDEIKKWALDPLSDEDKTYAINKIAQEWERSKVPAKTDKDVLIKYLNSFTEENSKVSNKRVCNFPFLTGRRCSEYEDFGLEPIIFENDNLPDFLKTVWRQCESSNVTKQEKIPLADIIYDATLTEEQINMSGKRHRSGFKQTFKYFTNIDETINLAVRGIGGKKHKGHNKVRDKRVESQMSFSPKCDTSDIKQFVESNSLQRFYDRDEEEMYILKLLNLAKSFTKLNSETKKENNNHINSYEVFKNLIINSELVLFADMISSICVELAACLRKKNKEGTFIYKRLRSYKVGMLITVAGQHVFVSYCFPKSSTSKIDTGRLGPECFETENYYITDFSSYNEVSLEHFAKSGPYFGAISIHLLNHYQFSLEELNQDRLRENSLSKVKKYWQTLRTMLLVYLNNKLDCEELLTSQRYFYMNVLQETSSDPYSFVSRLPDVMRSRLTVYFLNKTISNISFYHTHIVEKQFSVDENDTEHLIANNLKSLFCEGFVSLEQKINEFYFGYIVSKEKGKGSDKSFSIVKKIAKFEYKYLDMKEPILGDLEKPVYHRTDPKVFRFTLDIFGKICENKLGANYKDYFETNTWRYFVKTNFSDLATLKASARNHKTPFEPVLTEDSDTLSNILNRMKKLYPEEFRKRPKVMQALIRLVKEYEDENKKKIQNVYDLIPYCLKSLKEDGGFDCDVFSKSQHGGDREISVLEIKARVVQYYLEGISKTICRFFENETITHPKTKDTFVKNHYKSANATFDDFITVCKSADKEKWCQNHFCSKFAIMLLNSTNKIFHNFILTVLQLWMEKRVVLPTELIANFIKNSNTGKESLDPIFFRMKEDFKNKTGMFTCKSSNMVKVTSGMFQGILHYTSSLCHLQNQMFMQEIISQHIYREYGVYPVITIVEGSDDSGMMISIKSNILKRKIDVVIMLTHMMKWGEHIAGYATMFTSIAKTALGIINLIEYNSEWFLRQKICKPTFRWVSACLETVLVERFIDRYRIFYNTLSQCLEGGASTFECSMLEMCQAWLHYKLIGLDNHIMFKNVQDQLIKVPDPSFGFFPLDSEFSCGVGGFDFKLYMLAKNSSYGTSLLSFEDMIDSPVFNYDGHRDRILNWSLRGVKIKFSNIIIWKKLVDEIAIGEMQDAIDYINKNPDVLFGRHMSWEEERIHMILKLFNPSVRASLAGHQPLVRMFVASIYMINRPCLLTYLSDEKLSLYSSLQKRIDGKTEPQGKTLKDFFPNMEEYESLLQFVNHMEEEGVIEPSNLVRKSKVKLEVFQAVIDEEFPIVNLAKRKWRGFRGVVNVGKEHFEILWEAAKTRYTFLCDTMEETLQTMGIDVLKLWSLLQNLQTKSRNIILSDTSAKLGTLRSALTRIYWPMYKIRTPKLESNIGELHSLRSNIFSILTYYWSDTIKIEYISDLLKNSNELKKPIHEIPIKHKRMKIFRDYLVSTSTSREKWIIVSEILKLKKGCIGFFSEAQERSGKNRIGLGTWRGSVCGVDVKLDLDGNNCTLINISKFQDIENLGLTLANLLSEFGCEPKKEMSGTTSSLYLTRTGQFRNIKNKEVDMFPVKIDQNLEVHILSKFQGMLWKLIVNKQSVQLKVVDSISNSFKEFTILSDFYKTSEWDQDSICLLDDPFFKKWHNSESMSFKDFDIQIGKFITYGGRTNQDIKRLKTKATGANLNISSFKESLINHVFPSKGGGALLMSKLKETVEEDIMPSLQMDEVIQDLFKNINSIEYDFMEEKDDHINWAEEMEEEEETSDSDRYSEEIVDSLEIEPSLDVELVERYLEDIQESAVIFSETRQLFENIFQGMPGSNKYFSTLKYYLPVTSQVSNEQIFSSIIEGSITFPFIMGKIMSLAFLKNLIDDTSKKTIDSAYEEVYEGSVSSVTSDPNDPRHPDSIREKIRRLNELKLEDETVTELVAREINRLAMKLRLIRLEGEGKDIIQEEDLKMFHRMDVVNKISEAYFMNIGDANTLRMNSTSMEMVDYMNSKMRTELINMSNRQEVDQKTADNMKLSIYSNTVTKNLLNLLSKTINSEIRLTINGLLVSSSELESDLKFVYEHDTSEANFDYKLLEDYERHSSSDSVEVNIEEEDSDSTDDRSSMYASEEENMPIEIEGSDVETITTDSIRQSI